MSHDTPTTIPHRKRSITRYLAIAFVLLVSLFAYQLLGPNPPIIVSRQTTYITAPLRGDGLPDYVKFLGDKLSAGITPENNAAVLMWQAFGPGAGSDAVSPENWKRITEALQLPAVQNPRYLVEPYSRQVTAQLELWLRENDPAWKQVVQNPPAIVDGEPLPPELGYDVVSAAMDSPWRREQLPPLAEWADANRAPLDLLAEASRRPRNFSPFSVSEDDSNNSLLEVMQFDNITRNRTIARCLKLRAMLHLGEGRPEQAWQDLRAIHLWARLVGHGPTIIEQLVAIAINGIACEGTNALLGSELSPELARKIHQALIAFGPPSDMARSFDEGERFYFLDSVLVGRQQGVGTFLDENLSFEQTEKFYPLDYVSADWNVTLTQGNRWYNRLAAACRLPSHAVRRTEFGRVAGEIQRMEQKIRQPQNWAIGSLSPAKRSDMLAAAVITLLSPMFTACSDAEDRANSTLAITQLAAALAVYRAEHGQYPDRLEQLVPEIISELPVDLYHAKPFIYRREADGYLLYSTGPNGADDGGSNELRRILQGRELPEHDEAIAEELGLKIPTSADDLSIRIPASPFQLPTSPAPAP